MDAATMDRSTWTISLWGLALLALPACGANAAATTQDASTDASEADAAPTTVCPPTLPEAGTPCTMRRPTSGTWSCEYGADPRCTTIANCEGPGYPVTHGTWQMTPPSPTCSGNHAGCPAAFDPNAGVNGPTLCPTPGSCSYPEGSCACISCEGSGGWNCTNQNVCDLDGGPPRGADGGIDWGTTWHCETWPAPDGCPEPRPLLGTPCKVDPNVACGYGPLCCGLVPNPQQTMWCIQGFWGTGLGGC